MRVRIHRGATEIGGSCVEVEADGRALLLDLGLPLDSDGEAQALPVTVRECLDHGARSVAGIVISHGHPDHYGLVHSAPASVPVFMGAAAHRIAAEAAFWLSLPAPPPLFAALEDGRVLKAGPFEIVPYLVDHSGFDAYSILVAADRKRLLYTGDLRAHGRKSSLVERLPQRVGPVDVLMMEGTQVSATGASRRDPISEHDLEEAYVARFAETAGAALVFFSPQNVDRLVTVFRAAKRSGRHLLIDLYAADIAAATGRATIPQADWPEVSVFLPRTQRWRLKQTGAFGRAERVRAHRIFPEDLAALRHELVVLCRASLIDELEAAGCLNNASATWGMWPGYLNRPSGEALRARLAQLDIQLETLHASGHASMEDLKGFAAGFETARLVPVHTDAPERFESIFGRAELRADGEWWDA